MYRVPPKRKPLDLAAGIFSVPLLLTILIEMPVIAIVGRGSWSAWRAGYLVNTLTNPAAVLLVLVLQSHASYRFQPVTTAFVWGLEAAVVLVEWRVFRWVLGWSNRKAFIVSLVANSLSFGLGLALDYWPVGV